MLALLLVVRRHSIRWRCGHRSAGVERRPRRAERRPSRLTSTVTPQGIVGVAPYLDVDPLRHAAQRPLVRDGPARGPRPGERGHGHPIGRRRRAPSRRRVHRFVRGRVQPQRPCERRRGRSSICPSCARSGPLTRSTPCGGRGFRIFAMDVTVRRTCTAPDLGRPGGVRVRERGARVAARRSWRLADATVRVPHAGARRIAEPALRRRPCACSRWAAAGSARARPSRL